MSTTVTAKLIKIQERPHGFSSFNPNWTDEPNLNTYFVQSVQAYANNWLKDKGWLSLNTVFQMLGLEETEEGALAGWVKQDPIREGMSGRIITPGTYIDFGLLRRGPLRDDTRPFTLIFNVNSTNVFRDKNKENH